MRTLTSFVIGAATLCALCAACVAPQQPQVNGPNATQTADGAGSDVVCKEEVPIGSMISRTVCRPAPIGDPRDEPGLMNHLQAPHSDSTLPSVIW